MTTPKTIYRKDYSSPDYYIDEVSLIFELEQNYTTVIAESMIRQDMEKSGLDAPLVLDGENLELLALAIDGHPLEEDKYQVTEKNLTIESAPEEFRLTVTTRIYPDKNSSLEGLYRSSGNYCTQCEAEGFRKITYYLDRPDVMAKFTTRIEADQKENPVMLSNGNCIDSGKLDNGRHYVVWQDPFPKPCYLFALVAGNLVCIEDQFTTASGRDVALQIFVEERNKERCEHAMRSLKKAMAWDEEVYGLEYDLDIYMIVAVDDFNMGAMENKGLNVFNSKYVLASPETATDADYLGIEGVIAHEYFHNWTGNRVTCRDWFQLSLKEGLTVFRDQEFSADLNSLPVQRIDDVKVLRTYQFREDSGPMAHSVRPDSYLEINNFYTVTVYNKGAEVIRMMHSLLGAEGFHKGMDLYFARHDGQAVTCDDFVAAMADGANADLDQFKNWYSQAGTPKLFVEESWNQKEKQYSFTVRQVCANTPGRKDKRLFHVPIAVGFLNAQGKEVAGSAQILQLTKESQTFSYQHLEEKPVLSFLRGFSAPVTVSPFHNRDELCFLMANDNDLFNRWDAANQLSEMIVFDCVEMLIQNQEPVLEEQFVEAFRRNLQSVDGDKALLAQALNLPAETSLAQKMAVIVPDYLHYAREFVREQLGMLLEEEFVQIYEENGETGEYLLSPEAMGNRSLKNICLSYLMAGEALQKKYSARATIQYERATNMTDRMAALSSFMDYSGTEHEELLNDFYKRFKNDPLVMDKWLGLQASSSHKNCLERVKELLDHPVFSMNNPNKVRALIGAFVNANHFRFHESDGSGYSFLREKILKLNKTNPQIAARLVTPFTTWHRYDTNRQELMKKELEYMAGQSELTGDVYEIVSKSLLVS